jgi:hypothetical protein
MTTFLLRRFVLTIATCSLVARGFASAQEPVTTFDSLKAPEGFVVTQYADDELAHDIYSMTVDSQGRVVVAGAGYVRILLDVDNDGTADEFRQFADEPKNGAMGMFPSTAGRAGSSRAAPARSACEVEVYNRIGPIEKGRQIETGI